MNVLRRTALVLVMTLCACGSDEDGDGDGEAGNGGAASTEGAGAGSSNSGAASSSGTGGGASAASSGSASGGSTSSGGSGKEAICEAYAQLIIDCCDPPIPNCAPDKYDGWKQFCMEGYEACQAAYDCLAEADCTTSDACPNFGSGCM